MSHNEEFERRWAEWQRKGQRHDARIKRNLRRLAFVAVSLLAIGMIWWWVS